MVHFSDKPATCVFYVVATRGLKLRLRQGKMNNLAPSPDACCAESHKKKRVLRVKHPGSLLQNSMTHAAESQRRSLTACHHFRN